MNPQKIQTLSATLCLLSAGLPQAHALEEPSLMPNRVSLSGRFAFNISADLRYNALPANPAGTYDDGYVQPDVSGSTSRTWNWGYTHGNQVNGDAIEMHNALGSPRDGTLDSFTEAPQGGFDLTYGRELFRIKMGKKRSMAFGVEGGFSSMAYSAKREDTISGSIGRETSSFALGGSIPPTAPYSGSFNGPGPLLDLQPSSSVVDQGVPVTSAGTVKLDSLLFGLKAGAFLDLPITKRVSVQVGGGVAALYGQADLRFEEQIAYTEGFAPPPLITGDYDNSEWLIGFYGQATLSYAVSKTVQIFAGGQYQQLGDITTGGGGREATLDFGGCMEAVAGVRFTF